VNGSEAAVIGPARLVQDLDRSGSKSVLEGWPVAT
jgi:hypothetical protein